jgi:hypothetical protein
MAATKIADIIVPEVFNPYVIERTAELSAFWQSGVVETVEGLNVLGMEGGQLVSMPFFQDLSGADEILTDSADLTVDKIAADKDIGVLHARGKAWGVNDLAKALSGADPMAAIGDLVADYWARRKQVVLIETLNGALAAANMTANVHDISGLTGGAEIIDGASFVDATAKLGDNNLKLNAVAMHSATVAKLKKDDLITFIPDSEGKAHLPFYQGKRVIEDDSLPVATDVYTTYLFGPGAVGHADGLAPVPTETDRDSLAGEDVLINRQHFVMHPRGIQWNPQGGVPASTTPSNTELADGLNWNRVYEPKNIRIVQFIHKIA